MAPRRPSVLSAILAGPGDSGPTDNICRGCHLPLDCCRWIAYALWDPDAQPGEDLDRTFPDPPAGERCATCGLPTRVQIIEYAGGQ